MARGRGKRVTVISGRGHLRKRRRGKRGGRRKR